MSLFVVNARLSQPPGIKLDVNKCRLVSWRDGDFARGYAAIACKSFNPKLVVTSHSCRTSSDYSTADSGLSEEWQVFRRVVYSGRIDHIDADNTTNHVESR